jgi:hypothetical protein
MKKIKYFLLSGILAGVMFSCDPNEDRESMGEPLTPADLKYSITQESGYDNKVFLENQTHGTIPYWQYGLGTSTRDMDTVIFPFAGDYWIKFTALGKAGMLSDSTQINVSENDPNYFSDPTWNLLTGGVDGKYWKLVRVTLGPATDYTAVWGDVNWWAADAYNWNDSAYFDLNGGYHYTRFHNGQQTGSNFDLNLSEALSNNVLADPGRALSILDGNQLPVKDGSNEMAGSLKTHYRIYKLSADTLIVGQGSYYTASRTTEDWSYYHWYVWQK